jgi:hypothetical protein
VFTELIEPVDVSDSELAKFWGADLAELTAYQQALIAELFKKLKKRQLGSVTNPAQTFGCSATCPTT